MVSHLLKGVLGIVSHPISNMSPSWSKPSKRGPKVGMMLWFGLDVYSTLELRRSGTRYGPSGAPLEALSETLSERWCGVGVVYHTMHTWITRRCISCIPLYSWYETILRGYDTICTTRNRVQKEVPNGTSFQSGVQIPIRSP